MKKSFLFLISILLLLASCSSEDKYTDDTSSLSNQIRWYGSQLPEEPQTRGVTNGAKLWDQNANITVNFLNLPSDRALTDSLKQVAAEWEQYAGVHFDFVGGNQNADVRIAFNWMGNDWLTWSYTGTDAKTVTNQKVPTAVFGGLEHLTPQQIKGDMRRLLGQVLGLEYEQRHQQWAENGNWKDENQLQAYWEVQFKGYYKMKWNEVKDYVFTPMTKNNTSTLYATKDIDGKSIMAWPYYTSAQANSLIANYELSAGDKEFIAQLYPKNKQDLPTIQKAWVDAGYFTWANQTKTALWITSLGRRQENLPDVSDGEQLTSANRMFYLASKLKKVPQFNTSNITDFSNMFAYCKSLTSIPLLNTSRGVIFKQMFAYCSSLTAIPLLDTSKGANFRQMFQACSSLTTIPQLNTSNGTNFESMFTSCNSLTTIPKLDTSMGINFGGMFEGCNALTTIPKLDTSSGTFFAGMFIGCSSLNNIPLLDTSKGTTFGSMFADCNSLTTIPKLDTSKGTDFGWMFSRCGSLTNIPELNTSKGNIFNRMFTDCSSLTTIPKLDTSNGRDFGGMFSKCSSLISIPQLNTSKGTNFESMFYLCSSLAIKPQLDLSNAIGKYNMYAGTRFANDPL